MILDSFTITDSLKTNEDELVKMANLIAAEILELSVLDESQFKIKISVLERHRATTIYVCDILMLNR